MVKKKRVKRLTAAQKKIVWSKPMSNAGVGWRTKKDEEVTEHIRFARPDGDEFER